jgi:hypothetical protein
VHRTTLLLPLLLSPMAAQQVLFQGFGPAPNAATGEGVFGGGDLDGDGRPDLVVKTPGVGTGVFHAISGANGSVRTLNVDSQVLAITRDMNLDGTADLLLAPNNLLRAYSGATLTQLWQSPVQFQATAPIDDRTGDGRADVAALRYVSPGHEIYVLRGNDGGIHTQSVVSINTSLGSEMISIGDVTGDGVPELAVNCGSAIGLLRLNGQLSLFQLNDNCRQLAAADLVGDARNEILVGLSGQVLVLAANTGAIVRTFPNVYDGRFAVVGDANADGVPDLAVRRQAFVHGTHDGCEIVSGSTGAVLAAWPATAQVRCNRLVGLGDTNADGFGDFAIGDSGASVSGLFTNQTGGWQIVSGKILAFRESMPTNCAQGPFLPTIGMTLPKLGQIATVAGQDAPAGSVGLVAFSLKPAFPVNLGAFGCDAWFDLGGGSLLQTTTTTTWQFGLPIPPFPQLAGVGIALQAVYAPSQTAIGLDLTNGLWARAGF